MTKQIEELDDFCYQGSLKELLKTNPVEIVFITDRDFEPPNPTVLHEQEGSPRILWLNIGDSHRNSASRYKAQLDKESEIPHRLYFGYIPQSWFEGTLRNFLSLGEVEGVSALIPVVCNCSKQKKLSALQKALNEKRIISAVMSSCCAGETNLDKIYLAILELLQADS